MAGAGPAGGALPGTRVLRLAGGGSAGGARGGRTYRVPPSRGGGGGGGGGTGPSRPEPGGAPVEEPYDLDGVAAAGVLGKGEEVSGRLAREFPGCRVELQGKGARANVMLSGTAGVVGACRAELDQLVRQYLESPRCDYTHFVSIPLNSPALVSALEDFRERVMALPPEQRPGVDASIFAKPQHFHLTVCMLKLCSEAARRRAREVLRAFDFRDARAAPPRFSLGGLGTFSGRLDRVDVLFMKVAEAEGGRLQTLVDSLGRAFGESGLLLPRDRKERIPVKLHATVINTRFRKGAKGRKGAGRRSHCDCSQIASSLGGWGSGELQLREVHLSQRGAYRESDGFYLPLEVVGLQ